MNECTLCGPIVNILLVNVDLYTEYLCYDCWKRLKEEDPVCVNSSDEKLFIKNRKE